MLANNNNNNKFHTSACKELGPQHAMTCSKKLSS